jgi:hypothetical protein
MRLWQRLPGHQFGQSRQDFFRHFEPALRCALTDVPSSKHLRNDVAPTGVSSAHERQSSEFAVPDGFHPRIRARSEGEAAPRWRRRFRRCFADFVDVYGVPKAKVHADRAFEHMCEGSELYTVGALEGLGWSARRRTSARPFPIRTRR